MCETKDSLCFLLVYLGEGDTETKANLMSLEDSREFFKKFIQQPSLPDLSFVIEYLHISLGTSLEFFPHSLSWLTDYPQMTLYFMSSWEPYHNTMG